MCADLILVLIVALRLGALGSRLGHSGSLLLCRVLGVCAQAEARVDDEIDDVLVRGVSEQRVEMLALDEFGHQSECHLSHEEVVLVTLEAQLRAAQLEQSVKERLEVLESGCLVVLEGHGDQHVDETEGQRDLLLQLLDGLGRRSILVNSLDALADDGEGGSVHVLEDLCHTMLLALLVRQIGKGAEETLDHLCDRVEQLHARGEAHSLLAHIVELRSLLDAIILRIVVDGSHRLEHRHRRRRQCRPRLRHQRLLLANLLAAYRTNNTQKMTGDECERRVRRCAWLLAAAAWRCRTCASFRSA